MIPKVIHYCWFGGNPLPELTVKCIESWKRFCPDYEIIRWDESNYDLNNTCEFVKQAYHNKKWAFVSDYARLDILNRFGGIYLDTDVELLDSLDEVIKDCRGFFAFEKENQLNTGLGFASEKASAILEEMLAFYHETVFEVERMSQMSCPIINTKVLAAHGAQLNNQVQLVEGYKLLPMDYCCPESFYTGQSHYTQNTISVHHYNYSWMGKRERCRTKLILAAKKILPDGIVERIRKSIAH